ncbi:MAG: hypothetical protein IT557_13200 [Alphaproteobacteria bacterium]|nr:hypothetical protein [Alphaproteobacteria bacterium]
MSRTGSAFRAMLGLGAGALVALAASAGPARAQPAGEAAYQELCASCHRTPARFMRRYQSMTSEARRAELERFLPRHYAPDEARRRAIIDWLEERHVPAR